MLTFVKKLVKRNKYMMLIFNILKYLRGKASVTTIVPVYFDGWKMATGTRTPWLNGGSNSFSRDFSETDLQLKAMVSEKKILLTQFNSQNVTSELEGLTWRHFIVYWSTTYAIQSTKSERKNLAEFGVCDGLTAYYAISAANKLKTSFNAYLYDSWEPMKRDLLLDSEKMSTGSYSYLDLENTKSNLSHLRVEQLVYNKGYIPEVFRNAQNPDQLVWIHIDLNSAMPTIQVLDKFWDLLEVGGLILLDDFAWPGYEDTQIQVEKWIQNKKCNILHLPTGQAIIFKQGGSE
ncbi:MAG: hypothetical protein HOI47_31395 [Candidatus Scalindua sp.]|jgi:hypothetical protein|nr:hypothetical protein [Candidatus Scalindua sp.]